MASQMQKRCRVCGCTNSRPCRGGCSWDGDLCSTCSLAADAIATWAFEVDAPRWKSLINEAQDRLTKGRLPADPRVLGLMDAIALLEDGTTLTPDAPLTRSVLRKLRQAARKLSDSPALARRRRTRITRSVLSDKGAA